MSGGEISFDVFFSYHWRDHVPVETVARKLTERGVRVLLDRWYLAPGRPWPQALERSLASCNSVAVSSVPMALGVGSSGRGTLRLTDRDGSPAFR
jgi:hypothetical protein